MFCKYGQCVIWHCCVSWHEYLQTMSKCNQSWLICIQHRRSPHVYLTDLPSLNLNTCFSMLLPNCKCLWAWKCVCVLSGWNGSTVGEGDVAARMCRFSRLSSNLQALISYESEGMSLTGFPWHCQLLYSPRHHSFMLQSVLSGSPSPRIAQFYLIVVPEPWS